ncbi:MAG TPA: helix-turn-helix domain-containing protein [Solirubrobacteraceae bacterium]|nr:helix-turn-helix domain-containing protein [Solirubrobacteraceae bacterium]
MSLEKHNLLKRFAADPPVLEGGLALDLEPIDDRSALLLVHGDGGHRFRARAEALALRYPSGLRRLLGTRPRVDVVLVERASRGLDDAARELGVGYLDLEGRGRLVGPGFVYVVPPQTESSARRQDAAQSASSSGISPFARKASRVARALLAEPARAWRLADVAEACRMHPGTVHRILGALVDAGFVERDGKAYVVADPGSLLDAWAGQAARRAGERVQLPIAGDVRGAVEAIVDILGGAAVVSGELAAELYAPHLSAANALVHCVDRAAWDRRRVAAALPDRPLRASGQVVVDLVDEGVGDFAQVRDGLPLVAPHQLYVDMHRERSRAREAAEHVRAQVLGF